MGAKTKTFCAVAERSHGIKRGYGERPVNPFLVRDVFDPGLRHRVERRTWSDIPATNEKAARALFERACAASADLKGFRLVSIVEVRPPLTSCGYCSYEEADGELIEQCPTCKAADARRRDG